MIESCKLLGDMLLDKYNNKQDEIKLKVENVSLKGKKDKNKLLADWIFDLKKQQVSLDLKDINEKDVYKYMYIGNVKSSNAPPWRFTSSDRGYFIKIYIMLNNFCKLLKKNEIGNDLLKQIQEVIDTFFIDNIYFKDKKAKEENKLVDLNKFCGIKQENVFIDNMEEVNKSTWKNKSQTYVKKLLEQFNIKDEDIALNIVTIIDQNGNEICLSLTEEYQKLIYAELFEPTGKINKDTVCALCGKKGCVDDILFKFPFFQRTKTNWAFNLQKKNYNKQLSLCNDCYKAVSMGETTMKEKYSITMGNNTIFLAPKFVTANDDSIEFLEESLNKFIKIAGTEDQFNNQALKNISELFKNVYDYENIEYNFFIDMYFYELANASAKIKKSIYNIDSKYFVSLVAVFRQKDSIFANRFKDLNSIYYMYEKSNSKGDKERAAILFRRDISFIMNKNKIYRSSILRDVYPVIRFKYYSSKGNSEISLLNNIDILRFYIDKIRELGLLEVIDKDIISEEQIKNLREEDIKYIISNEFTRVETGLFLLGTVVNDVAYMQYKSSNNKAILDSINMRGMNSREVDKLIARVTLKLKELSNKSSVKYIISSDNVLRFQLASELLSKAKKEGKYKKYSKEEILNSIYLGYLYFAKNRIINSKNKGEENNGK